MEKKIPSLGGVELHQRIKTELAEKNISSFELHDPRHESTYPLLNAEAAIAKAEELGAKGFRQVLDDGRRTQIRKNDGEWNREDGKSLSDIQAEIDKDSLKAIEARSAQRAAIGQGDIPSGTDELMAKADARAFNRIQDHVYLKAAAVVISNNAIYSSEYNEALNKNHSETADKVVGFAREAFKDERDIAEYATREALKTNFPRMDVSVLGPIGDEVEKSRGLADKLGVTADIYKMSFSGMTHHEIAGALKDKLGVVNELAADDERASQRDKAYFVQRVKMSLGVPPNSDQTAFKDWQEQAATVLSESVKPEVVKAEPESIVLDDATKDRLAGMRARDMAQAQELLGLNTIEPDFERKRQAKLAEGEEAKRAAWLKKGADEEKTQPRPPEKERVRQSARQQAGIGRDIHGQPGRHQAAGAPGHRKTIPAGRRQVLPPQAHRPGGLRGQGQQTRNPLKQRANRRIHGAHRRGPWLG